MSRIKLKAPLRRPSQYLGMTSLTFRQAVDVSVARSADEDMRESFANLLSVLHRKKVLEAKDLSEILDLDIK